MTGKRLKDFYRFVRSVESFTDGQVRVLDWDEAELKEIRVQIQPNDGDYEGGRFDFTIKLANDFPETYPEVNCDTEIYHPNIDPTSDNYNVCLSLFDEWSSNFGMRDVIQGLLFLFYEPNVDDPLSSYFGDSLTDEEFTDNVRASLRGEDVDGYEFPWNYYGHDAEMLKRKPQKVEKLQENEETTENAPEQSASEDTTKTEDKEENNNELNPEDKEAIENAKTETGRVEETEETKAEGDERSESDEKKDNETEEKTDEIVVIDEPTVQDITVIIEKVSELILQYPEDDEEKENEKENSAEEATTETIIDQEEARNNDVQNREDNEEVTGEAQSDDLNGAAENRVENPTTIAIQRQISKTERQCSVTNEATGATNNISEEITSTDKYSPFAQYVESFRASTFGVAPDFGLTVNIIGLACFCLYKSFKT